MPKKGGTQVSYLRRALEIQVARFRTWADTIPVAERSGEWECLYSEWPDIYRAFSALISGTTCEEWDDEVTKTLLYIIARDNDMQELVNEIAKHPDSLMCLAQQALSSAERDAKWQLAVALGGLNRGMPQVESVLLQFMHDTDEYVRRCSLIALADIGSEEVEDLAVAAWATEDEYQRMAALYALWKAGFAQLDAYLTDADTDGRQYLVDYARRIRSGHPA